MTSLTLKQFAILKAGLAVVLLLGIGASISATPLPSNRCKDRCNDAYQVRKDLCRAIPLKHERKACENAAKRAKDNCKHRCR
jgi:hypothetical protein